MKDVTPPRLARAVLRLVVPKHDRIFVVEDLDEEFAVLAAEGRSDRYLRRWYWGQVRSSILPSLKRPRVPPLRRRTWSDVMHSVIHDVRYAFRTLFRQPAYALTVIGMLTLGIAGNTAIFSVFNGLFLRPLPFSEPGQLVNFDETAPRWDLEYVGMAYPDFGPCGSCSSRPQGHLDHFLTSMEERPGRGSTASDTTASPTSCPEHPERAA